MKRSRDDTDPHRVRSWDIHVTAPERQQITLGARKAKMTIRQFILTGVRTAPRRDPTRWACGLQILEAIEQHLCVIAAETPSEDACATISVLLSLEREIRRIAKPWTADQQPSAADP